MTSARLLQREGGLTFTTVGRSHGQSAGNVACAVWYGNQRREEKGRVLCTPNSGAFLRRIDLAKGGGMVVEPQGQLLRVMECHCEMT